MPDVLTERPLTVDDAEALVELLDALERHEPVDEAFNVEDVVEELTAPGIELDVASVAILDGPRLIGYGVLQLGSPTPDRWPTHTWGGVHPEYTRRGLGTRILRRLAAAAERMRDERAPGRPGELTVWADRARIGTAALAAAEGYRTWRYFFRMRAALDGVRAPGPDPDGIVVRRYRSADEDAVRLVSNEAFADHWGSTPQDPERWHATYEASASFRPEQSFVAEATDGDPGSSGGMVGYILTMEYAAESAARGHRTGYISRVGTARAARGRGVASAVLAHTLDGLAGAGYAYAELGVDADSPAGAGRLYERAGFVTTSQSRVLGRRF